MSIWPPSTWFRRDIPTSPEFTGYTSDGVLHIGDDEPVDDVTLELSDEQWQQLGTSLQSVEASLAEVRARRLAMTPEELEQDRIEQERVIAEWLARRQPWFE